MSYQMTELRLITAAHTMFNTSFDTMSTTSFAILTHHHVGGANVLAKDTCCARGVLHEAAVYCSLHFVQELIAHLALDPATQDKWGATAADRAEKAGT